MQCIASKWTIKHCKFLTNYFFCRLISTPTLMKNLNNFSVIYDFLCYPEKDVGKVYMDIIYKTFWVFRGQVRKITSLSPTLWLEHGSEGTDLDCFSICLFVLFGLFVSLLSLFGLVCWQSSGCYLLDVHWERRWPRLVRIRPVEAISEQATSRNALCRQYRTPLDLAGSTHLVRHKSQYVTNNWSCAKLLLGLSVDPYQQNQYQVMNKCALHTCVWSCLIWELAVPKYTYFWWGFLS